MPFYNFLAKTTELLQEQAKLDGLAVPREEIPAKWCTNFIVNYQLSDKKCTKWDERKKLLEAQLAIYNEFSSAKNSSRAISHKLLVEGVYRTLKEFELTDGLHIAEDMLTTCFILGLISSGLRAPDCGLNCIYDMIQFLRRGLGSKLTPYEFGRGMFHFDEVMRNHNYVQLEKKYGHEMNRYVLGIFELIKYTYVSLLFPKGSERIQTISQELIGQKPLCRLLEYDGATRFNVIRALSIRGDLDRKVILKMLLHDSDGCRFQQFFDFEEKSLSSHCNLLLIKDIWNPKTLTELLEKNEEEEFVLRLLIIVRFTLYVLCDYPVSTNKKEVERINKCVEQATVQFSQFCETKKIPTERIWFAISNVLKTQSFQVAHVDFNRFYGEFYFEEDPLKNENVFMTAKERIAYVGMHDAIQTLVKQGHRLGKSKVAAVENFNLIRSKLEEQKEEQFQCGVCYENSTENKKYKFCHQCSKAICVKCWQEILARGNPTCPYCRAKPKNARKESKEAKEYLSKEEKKNFTYKDTYFGPCMILYHLFQLDQHDVKPTNVTRLKFFYTPEIKSGKLLGVPLDVVFYKMYKYLGKKNERTLKCIEMYEDLLKRIGRAAKDQCSTLYFPKKYNINNNANDEVLKKLVYRSDKFYFSTWHMEQNIFELEQRIIIHRFQPKTKTFQCSKIILRCSRYLTAAELQRYVRLEMYKHVHYDIYQPCIRHKFQTCNATYANPLLLREDRDDRLLDLVDMAHIAWPSSAYWRNLEFYDIKKLKCTDRIIERDSNHVSPEMGTKTCYYHPIILVPSGFTIEKDFTYLHQTWPYHSSKWEGTWPYNSSKCEGIAKTVIDVQCNSIYVPVGEEKKRKKEKHYDSFETYYGIERPNKLDVDGFCIIEKPKPREESKSRVFYENEYIVEHVFSNGCVRLKKLKNIRNDNDPCIELHCDELKKKYTRVYGAYEMDKFVVGEKYPLVRSNEHDVKMVTQTTEKSDIVGFATIEKKIKHLPTPESSSWVDYKIKAYIYGIYAFTYDKLTQYDREKDREIDIDTIQLDHSHIARVVKNNRPQLTLTSL